MRNLRKLTAVVMAIALVLTSMTAAFAADSTAVNADKAVTLKDLGLYAGTDPDDPSKDLDKDLTTQDSLVFLAKLFGYKDDADKLTADEVTDALAKFDDADEIAEYAKNVVAYSAVNGILSGSADKAGLFVKPEATVTGARFATFILKQLGYEVPDYTEAASQLSEVKGSKADDDAADLTRDAAVGVMYGVLTAENAKGDTVISGIIGTDAKLTKIAKDAGLLPTETTGEIAVESVTSSQLNQVVVEFSNKVDKALVEDEDKYSIDEESDWKFKSAKLQEDGKTVILTLDDEYDSKNTNGDEDVNKDDIIDEFNTFDNSDEYTLVIDKAIVDTEVKFTPVDSDLPVAESIKLTGPDTFEVKFSEPISAKSMTADDSSDVYEGKLKVDIDDGVYEGTCKAKNTDTVEVTMDSASLDEGKYAVKISGAEDFAGHAALLKKFDLDYVKDTTAPEPKLVSASQTEVKIDFGKKVEDGDGADLDRNYFYHTTAKYLPDDDDDAVDWDGTVVTLKFTEDPLPTGKDVKIGVNYDGGDSDSIIRDKWGNKMSADALFYVDISSDNEGPSITKIAVNEQNEIEIFFSEALGEGGKEYDDGYKNFDTDSFIITKNDKDADVDISAEYNKDDNSITVKFDDDLDGTYKISLKDITDASVNENEVDHTDKEFVVDDISGINTDDVNVTYIDDKESNESYDQIIVDYPDDMASSGNYSVLDLSNYQVDYGTGKFVDFADKDKASFLSGSDTVKITIADEDKQDLTKGGIRLKIGKVADKAGNTSIGDIFDVIQDTAPMVEKVEMTSYKTIEVTFGGVIKTAPAAGFKVTNTSGTSTIADVVTSVSLAKKEGDDDKDNYEKNDYTVATLTLKSGQQLQDIVVQNPNVASSVKVDTEKYHGTKFADKSIYVDIVAGKIKSTTDKPVNDFRTANLKYAVDKIAPELCDDNDEYVVGYYTTGAAITFTYTEDLTNVSSNGVFDFLVKDEDGDKITAGQDYTVEVKGNTVIVKITKSTVRDDLEDYTVQTIDSPDFIKDNAGNEIKSFGAKKLKSCEF